MSNLVPMAFPLKNGMPRPSHALKRRLGHVGLHEIILLSPLSLISPPRISAPPLQIY